MCVFGKKDCTLSNSISSLAFFHRKQYCTCSYTPCTANFLLEIAAGAYSSVVKSQCLPQAFKGMTNTLFANHWKTAVKHLNLNRAMHVGEAIYYGQHISQRSAYFVSCRSGGFVNLVMVFGKGFAWIYLLQASDVALVITRKNNT